MKQLTLWLAALAANALISIASPGAVAADIELAPEEVSVLDWTGLYIGIQGGWKHHEDEVQDPIPPYSTDFDFDGGVFGGHAGYDHQFGSLVLGIVGDFEWAGGDGESDGFGVADDIFAKAEANWEASIRARFGFAFDSFLIYGTAGWAFANYDFDYTCCFPGGPPTYLGDDFDETIDGFTIGAGAAWAMSPAWVIWADYRFTDYDEASSDITNCCSPPPNRQDHDVETQSVRVGISYYFGQ
jgi:outer membrane immunogenic protein